MRSFNTRTTPEDEYYSKAALDMAKTIDQEILDTLKIEELLKQGWVDSRLRAPTDWIASREWIGDTAEWCHTQCTGDYKYCGQRWFFDDSRDCTAFLLKWA